LDAVIFALVLFVALFCLCYCDQQRIAENLTADFDAIRQEIANADVDNVQMMDIHFGRLRRSLPRCNIRTAERIARKIVEMDRALTSGDSQ
jgi:hypothetical protein